MKESYFQFSNPAIVNLEFCGNKDFDKDLFEGFNIDNEVNIVMLDEEKGNDAQVFLKICIGEKTNAFPFFISITMSAEFRCEEDKCDMFHSLLETNAPALLLSYARPVISMITSQSIFPTLDIPFMNFKD